MSKKVLSVMLTLALCFSAMFTTAFSASAAEGVAEDGEYFTYYVLCPEYFFTTNDSIGLYYWTPVTNAPWPGVEITKEAGCVYEFGEDAEGAYKNSRIYKVQVWQENADTQDELVTTPTILFNSFVDANIDPVNGHQLDNIAMEGYYKGDVETLNYGEGETEAANYDFPVYDSSFTTLNFNNMIYVPNLRTLSENEFSGARAIKDGVWYFYWGEGEYGVTEEKPSDSVDTDAPVDTDTAADTDTVADTDSSDVPAPVPSTPDDANKGTPNAGNNVNTDTTSPQTGDITNMAVVISVLLSAVAIAIVLRKRITD